MRNSCAESALRLVQQLLYQAKCIQFAKIITSGGMHTQTSQMSSWAALRLCRGERGARGRQRHHRGRHEQIEVRWARQIRVEMRRVVPSLPPRRQIPPGLNMLWGNPQHVKLPLQISQASVCGEERALHEGIVFKAQGKLRCGQTPSAESSVQNKGLLDIRWKVIRLQMHLSPVPSELSPNWTLSVPARKLQKPKCPPQ